MSKITVEQVRQAVKDPEIFSQLSLETQNIIKAAEILGNTNTKKKKCRSCSKKTGLNIPFYKELYKNNKEIFDTYHAKHHL